MNRLFLAATSTLVALLLPGCLQNETTVTLNKDGSGTLVEQTTLGGQMLSMLEQFAAFGGQQGADPVAKLFSAEKAKEKAGKLGEGVTFEKSEPLTVGGGKGAKMTYRFTDINKLKVSPGSDMSDLSPMAGAPGAPPKVEQKPVTFNYAGGTLTVTMPDPQKPAADPPKPDGAPDLSQMGAQEQAAMKEMMGDMKMSFKLVIEPGISETDATHRDGKTITLMEMEMGKLLEKPDTLEKLSKLDQNNPAAAMEAFKGINGVKMETKKIVTVKVD
ncbi:MAG: hypothetical protein EOP85_05090 [Verrucomicrobiaceae bacterium]|nr:MAG: hypothetical protein EOP85_05090 [Verrucomicrobiaceae bacterium]